MSLDHAEFLRQGFDALRRRDADAFAALVHSDCIWVPPANWPENAPIHGPAEIWGFIVDMDDFFEEGAYVLVDVVECGEGRAVAHIERSMRGKTSGVDAQFEYWNIVTLRDGKMARSEWFENRTDALAAAS